MSYPMGCIRETDESLERLHNQLVKTQGSDLFGDLAPHLTGSGQGKLSMPYLAALKFQENIFADEAQKVGSCTSHACRNAIDVARAAEIVINGEPEDWVARTSCEAIYGYRSNRGEGMMVSEAASLINKYGFLSRLKYPFADLSVYNDHLGSNMGGRKIPQSWYEEMKKHNMRYVTLAKKPEEVIDALANGYSLFRGSFNYAITTKNSKEGVARVTGGSWGHAQAILGVDDTKTYWKETMIVEANSWGPNWCTPGSPYWGKLPRGSYILYFDEWVNKLFRQGNVYIVGDSNGYKAKELPDFGSGEWL